MSRYSFDLGTDNWTIGYDAHQASYFVQRLDERHEELHDLGGDKLGALPTLEDAERLLPAGYELPAETRASLAAEQPADPTTATAAANKRMAELSEQMRMAMADSAPRPGTHVTSTGTPAPALPRPVGGLSASQQSYGR